MQLKPDLDRETPKEWIVYLPLAGIAGISGNSLKIGRARLQYMNSVEMDALRGKVDSILSASSAARGDKGTDSHYKFLRERTETLKETVCAVYHITAESNRAKEIAEEQTQDVLDLLSYFISFIRSRDYKVQFGCKARWRAGTVRRFFFHQTPIDFTKQMSGRGRICPSSLPQRTSNR